MKLLKRIIILLTTLVLTVATFLSGQANLSAFNLHTVFADEIVDELSKTDVLEDLEKSPHFIKEDYKSDIIDSSLSVITIAESVNGYLYIYVYQPSNENLGLRATSINISTTIGSDLNYTNYLLEYVNHTQVWYKYIVTELVDNVETPVLFTNPALTIDRVYEISGIYREFDTTIDSTVSDDNDNTINEVVFEVGKRFRFSTNSSGQVSMCIDDIELIQITDKFVGFLKYSQGILYFPFLTGFKDYSLKSHFIAFDTDKEIEKLLEVQVFYESQKCETRMHFNFDDLVFDSYVTNEDIIKHNKVIDYNDKSYMYGSDDNGDTIKYGLFSPQYNDYDFSCIQTVDEFYKEFSNYEDVTIFECDLFDIKQSSQIKDFAQHELSKCKYFIRFANYEYESKLGDGFISDAIKVNETKVANVSLMRLKFESDGEVYNLGVLDNKTTGSNSAINTNATKITVYDSFKFFISFTLGAGIIVLLFIYCRPLLIFILKGFGYIFKAVWWLITLPFTVFKKKRKK